MPLEREQLGDRLRRVARGRGFHSDEDAARHIGVSYRQYQRWLSGESEPRGSSLKLIAEALDVPLTTLVGEPDPSQLDRIEEMLTLQGRTLAALQETLEAEKAERARRAAAKAQRSAPGTPHAADLRREA